MQILLMGVCRIDAKLRVLLADESSLDSCPSGVESGSFTQHWVG
jgi:hypothetical protein